MTVSVVIPVYNAKPYLDRCVQSVLRQTYTDIEILLVDDGSTDGSGHLCDQIATRDKRIHVIHQQNHGLSSARNAGIRQAAGEYIIFLDSDDEWLLDDGLETLLREGGEGNDLIIFKNVHIWRNERYDYTKDYDLKVLSRLHTAQDVFTYLVMTQQFRMSACFLLVRRKLLTDYDIYFPLGLISEDVPWSLHLWQHASLVSFFNLDFYGYYHRADSLSSTPSIHVYESYGEIFSYWKEQCKNDCVNKESILTYLADMWVNRGYYYLQLKKADRPEALNILRQNTDLLQHAVANKTKITAWLVKHLGIRCSVFLMGVYWYIHAFVKRHHA